MYALVVLYLISQITPFDEDFKQYEFDIREFCKVCGIDYDNGGNYELLKQQIMAKNMCISTLALLLGANNLLMICLSS